MGFILLSYSLLKGQRESFYSGLSPLLLSKKSTPIALPLPSNALILPSSKLNIELPQESKEIVKLKGEECNIFDGRWVFHRRGYPLYEARRCPFLCDQVNCQKNGRPDSGYEHWRWEPKSCDLPRKNWCYNGTHPLANEAYVQRFPRTMISIMKRRIGKMRTPVKDLNITRLSVDRIDGHTSVYTARQREVLSAEQRK